MSHLSTQSNPGKKLAVIWADSWAAKYRYEKITELCGLPPPVHVVAARCGHDPAELLRTYAKRTRKADNSAAGVIGSISKGILGS